MTMGYVRNNLLRMAIYLVVLTSLCCGCSGSPASASPTALPMTPSPGSTAISLATTALPDTPGPAATATSTATALSTDTPSPEPTATLPATAAPAASPSPAPTNTPQATATPTQSPSPAPTATATATPTPSAYDWLQFDFDPQHSGNNTLETAITPANVGSLKRLFQFSLPAIADGAPAYLSGVQTPNGVRDLLFLTTKAGHILALDAHTGEQIWMRQYAAGACRINNGSRVCYTTSSPVVDPDRQCVYSYGLDGYVHKYRVGDGTEIKSGGWPELTTHKPYNEKGSSALSMTTARDGTTYLYVTNGGYLGDRGDYQGHVTAIDLADGTQRVFNANCSDQAVHFVEKPGSPDCPAVQSAIWARAGVVYDAATDRIYMATGNGTFAPNRHDWGDSVFALAPDGTGANGDPLDSYTPNDYQRLQNLDLDLGSTAPAILPVPALSTISHLALQGGKDQVLRLLDLEDLSGKGGPGHTGGEVQVLTGVVQGMIFTAPAVWVNPADDATWAFLADPRVISGLRLTVDSNGRPNLERAWTVSGGGSSPIVVNGIVFYASYGGIRALDPTTGDLLWQDTQIGNIHWESPIVANGVLYITDESGRLTAYSLQ
jgi:outer membrane protein assembly factor BamB